MRKTYKQALSAARPSAAVRRPDGEAASCATHLPAGIAGFLFLIEELLRILCGATLSAAVSGRLAAAFEAALRAATSESATPAPAAPPSTDASCGRTAAAKAKSLSRTRRPRNAAVRGSTCHGIAKTPPAAKTAAGFGVDDPLSAWRAPAPHAASHAASPASVSKLRAESLRHWDANFVPDS